MRNFYISSPLKWRVVTQPFGVNYVDFYKQFGLKGHNGEDYRADIGTPCLACFDGVVVCAAEDYSGGKEIRVRSNFCSEKGVQFEAIYYHLSEFDVKEGDEIKEGQTIGKTGNTGKYTTGAHLHFGLKEVKVEVGGNRTILNYDNGYLGAIDPRPYFKDGMGEYLPVDAYYERERSWFAEFKMRFKNPWLHKFFINTLKRNPLSLSNREVNALVYGGWGVEEVFDPAWYPIWATLKKADFKNKVKTPIKLIR